MRNGIPPPQYRDSQRLRQDKTTFTHSGMMNLFVDGGKATMYFDDLSFDGKTDDSSIDPTITAKS
jgi:hypothetical protein